MFQNDQKKFYQEMGGVTRERDIKPDPLESCDFWSNIWDNPTEHNQEEEWLDEVREDLSQHTAQEDVMISVLDVKQQLKKISNWKGPGPDGVQRFWLKNFIALHCRIAEQLNLILEFCSVPQWMNQGKTILCVKDPSLKNAAENFWPITYLPLMWKLLSGMLSEKMYYHFEMGQLLSEEEKGCRKRSRGTKDQLLIDKMVLRNCKRRKTNLAMAWIDYRKAYDMVPHSWILETLELTGIATNIQRLVRESMQN